MLQSVTRTVWLPIRALIAYRRSTHGSVLNISFPDAYVALMRALSSFLTIVDFAISGGARRATSQMGQGILLQPCALLAIVLYYVHERARTGRDTARKHAVGNAFFVLFFCCRRSATLCSPASSARISSTATACSTPTTACSAMNQTM